MFLLPASAVMILPLIDVVLAYDQRDPWRARKEKGEKKEEVGKSQALINRQPFC